MLLKDYFRFRVAIIAITPDSVIPFTYPLENKHWTVSLQGPKFFNSLNIKIQNVGTLSLFNSKLVFFFVYLFFTVLFFLHSDAA